MNNLLNQLEEIAQTKDAKTKQELLTIKNRLITLLSTENSSHATLGIGPDDIALGRKDIQQSQELLPEVKSLVLIVKQILINNSNGNYLNIKQKTIVEARQKKNPWVNFSYSRLDAMERIYRNAGRKVTYDSPGYTESYDANFTFEAKK